MNAPLYQLTPTARQHLREAKAWSRKRWGKEQTETYFHDIHAAVRSIAENYRQAASRKDLAGESGLGIYPIREHYIVYAPLESGSIAIVAFIRQERDVPAILSKYAPLIKRELMGISK